MARSKALIRALQLVWTTTAHNGASIRCVGATPKDFVKRLRSADWFQFELVTAALYERIGYSVTRRGGANPDGGIDLIVETGGQKIAIQCKYWKSWRVGVKEIREFMGALLEAGLGSGIFITVKGYTLQAEQLAHKHNIEIVDERGLLRLVKTANGASDKALWEILNDTRKICPKCESPMVLRTVNRGINMGDQFWGCSRYPRCRFKFEANSQPVLFRA